ncbi:ribbon-helix-helix domain-containing protein [Bifidobacterium sp. ESL0769]|uniref:ribbon-helix-helix domain-containing protein n=1 Tax=Bifidobacterium sp. ESL0769 TaxID=2983229 RepID=UPI0023F6AE06|nr:CopG family transcriptional regulator [Bifidobacterium sp. ESL0769]WEV67388.1 ribbon-helix-helix domain-containing protein [Bifidobacterium sp. ESL0769]
MDINEYMNKHHLTDKALDAMADVYEHGKQAHSDAPVHGGSHLDAVGKKRVTVVYDASDTQRVAALARERGVKPSNIYRAALNRYLATQS